MSPYWGASELRPRGRQVRRARSTTPGSDRASAVVGVRRGHHARRHRGGGAAGGAAGRVFRLPGVARGPEAAWFGGREEPELGGVGHLPQMTKPTALCELLGHARAVVTREGQAFAEGRARQLGPRSFKRKGTPRNGPSGQCTGRLGPGAVVEVVDDHVELQTSFSMRAIAPLTNSASRDLLGADELRLRRCVQPCHVLAHEATVAMCALQRPARPGSVRGARVELWIGRVLTIRRTENRRAEIRRTENRAGAADQTRTGSAGRSAPAASPGRRAPVRIATASVTLTSVPHTVQRLRSSSSPPHPLCWRIIGRSPSSP